MIVLGQSYYLLVTLGSGNTGYLLQDPLLPVLQVEDIPSKGSIS